MDDRVAAADVGADDLRFLHAGALAAKAELDARADAEQTVPVASFRVGPDGTATVRVPLPANPAGYRYFDLSRQEVGDLPASADSVLRGPTSPPS